MHFQATWSAFMKIISSFAFVLLLVGCASQQIDLNQPVKQVSVSNLNDEIIKLHMKQKEECMKPEYEPLRLKAPCSAKDVTFAQLADTTKITDAQKSLFMKAAAVMDGYSKSITELYRQSGSSAGQKIADARDWAYGQSNNNRLELVERQITWGSYLKNRQSIEQEMIKRTQ